jgi:hypothetical protein
MNYFRLSEWATAKWEKELAYSYGNPFILHVSFSRIGGNDTHLDELKCKSSCDGVRKKLKRKLKMRNFTLISERRHSYYLWTGNAWRECSNFLIETHVSFISSTHTVIYILDWTQSLFHRILKPRNVKMNFILQPFRCARLKNYFHILKIHIGSSISSFQNGETREWNCMKFYASQLRTEI